MSETKRKTKPSRFINLTGHDVIDYNTKRTFPAARDSEVVRVIYEPEEEEVICGVKTASLNHKINRKLPEPEEGVYYIVSKKVAMAENERPDLFYPGGIVTLKNNTQASKGFYRYKMEKKA